MEIRSVNVSRYVTPLREGGSLPAIVEADETFRPLLTSARLREIVSLIPEEWLRDEHAFDTVDAHRQAYLDFLQARVAQSHLFIKEAEHARAALV